MNLKTEYLGLQLPHPIITGASPMVDNLDLVRRLEDSGAAAIVMHSLFEEQVTGDENAVLRHLEPHEQSFAEAASFLPHAEDFRLGPEEYLEQIRRLKETVKVPVIASLNGRGIGTWIDYARLIERAGADALELNLYFVPTDPNETGIDVESRTLDVLRAVRANVTLPIAVKLSPYYSSLPHLANGLISLGANGLVLFNRFFQPDIDPERLENVPKLEPSNSMELRLRLRWLAILRSSLDCSLACSGGVQRAVDVVKAVMAGADAVQVVTPLLSFGPHYLRVLLQGLREWFDEHEFTSVAQMKGNMSLRFCPNPEVYERANYVRTLQLWRA